MTALNEQCYVFNDKIKTEDVNIKCKLYKEETIVMILTI